MRYYMSTITRIISFPVLKCVIIEIFTKDTIHIFSKTLLNSYFFIRSIYIFCIVPTYTVICSIYTNYTCYVYSIIDFVKISFYTHYSQTIFTRVFGIIITIF
ncbi:SWPV1-131 [Shearwaterpox virus]|uniref:SWPV1-131 n=1 Tax=Shearwaterpox virus TaxID=1974596 RepID=A0A1V0S7W7_CNPV|nr:SWPV1-131 [Shearwaterpox virus]